MNSASSTGKKVDRRTAYTRMTVKDASKLSKIPAEKLIAKLESVIREHEGK